jgi:HK97 family phage prohead protease
MGTSGPNGLETRVALELRVAGRRLEGYAAVFDQPTSIGSFTEVIRAGATRNSVAGGQIIALADHDPTRLIARQSSGTLRLAEDSRGLHFDLSLPDTSVGRDLLELATRGDIGGASIGFRAVQEAWPTMNSRELHQIDLSEISIVSAHPAYPQTSVSARARAMGHHEAARRLRLLTLMGA